MDALSRLGSVVATIAGVLLFCGSAWSQTRPQPETSQPIRSSLRQHDTSELSQGKSDVAQLQALLNQMQANYGLVGNPTAPANHELQLNMEMWRILIAQMQRRISYLEAEEPDRSTGPKKSAEPPRTPKE